MKVMTFNFYITLTMMYGMKVVLVLFGVCHYFLFFAAALSFTTLQL